MLVSRGKIPKERTVPGPRITSSTSWEIFLSRPLRRGKFRYSPTISPLTASGKKNKNLCFEMLLMPYVAAEIMKTAASMINHRWPFNAYCLLSRYTFKILYEICYAIIDTQTELLQVERVIQKLHFFAVGHKPYFHQHRRHARVSHHVPIHFF